MTIDTVKCNISVREPLAYNTLTVCVLSKWFKGCVNEYSVHCFTINMILLLACSFFTHDILIYLFLHFSLYTASLHVYKSFTIHFTIHVCEIYTVLGNPSSLLKMSSCFATLSTMRQSATKPPVRGPLSEAPGWPRTDREHLCHCLCLIR